MERKEENNYQETKSFKFEIKKLSAEGEFEGYAAVFNMVDAGGDIIEPGAFRKTIRDNRGIFPMTWYHNVRDPIGGVKVKEDEHGLFVKGKLNLEVQSAKEKYALMKQEEPGPVIKGLSFGYDTIKQEFDESGKKPVRRLKELKLYEVAPVLFAMQSHAQITDVKMEGKPSTENHICRLNSGDYVRYRSETRKHDGKTFTVRFGIRRSDGKAEEYEYFYAKDTWTAAQARKHCKDHDGKFTPALKSLEGVLYEINGWQESECETCRVLLTPEQSGMIVKAIETLEALLQPSEPPQGTPEEGKSHFSSVIEELKGPEKPQEHLFGSTIKILKNKQKENE